MITVTEYFTKTELLLDESRIQHIRRVGNGRKREKFVTCLKIKGAWGGEMQVAEPPKVIYEKIYERMIKGGYREP